MKLIKKTISIAMLVVDFAVNGREKNNYDVPAMREQIRAAGRIHTPVIWTLLKDANGVERKVVLQGNRRTLAGQDLLNDPHIPSDLKEALLKTETMEATDLSPKEQFDLIYDHGSQKPLSRTEVVKGVWRLMKEMFSEAEVINLLYFNLAKYSGNERKLREVPSSPKEREAFLKKWMHGTVGNFIMAASRMGEYVRQQFILTHRAEDGLLEEGEKVEIRMSRVRITELSQAKTDDKLEWTPEKGGPKFNELLEKFRKEDAGEITEQKIARPSVKELKERADSFKTPSIRKVLLIAAGETGDAVKGLADDDDVLYRQMLVREVLVGFYDKLKEPYKTFVHQVLDAEPDKLKAYLESL